MSRRPAAPEAVRTAVRSTEVFIVSRPALLANENVPALMVAELRRSGVQVESVSAIWS